jgi:recombinational DNA repair ATPase RecF
LDDLEGRGGLSRGQAKVAVCLMQMAAECVHRNRGLAPALWLLDDLESELDGPSREGLAGLFAEWATPRFTTRVGSGSISLVPTRHEADQCSTWNIGSPQTVTNPHPPLAPST